MDRYDYLIIGGGIAGVTAAETIRAESSAASIAVISSEPHLLYSRVLLPHYLKKRITREQVFLRSRDDFIKRGIALMPKEEVTFVDVAKKEVGLGNRTALGYGALLIAAGGRARTLGGTASPDGESTPEFVYHLQTIDDADRLMIALPTIKNPLVVGSSFIGLEFLEIFHLHNITSTVVSQDPHFFSSLLDPSGGEILRDNFLRRGIEAYLGETLTEVDYQNETRAFSVKTKQGRTLAADAIAAGIGIERNLGFLQGSGLAMGQVGLKVNEYLEASVEGVYAVGDIAEYYDVILEKYGAVGNWNNAFMQGKRVALNMLGKREAFLNVASYSITNFGYQITALGDTSGSDTLVRMTPKGNTYERLFFSDGRLVGAALINRFPSKIPIAKLIQTRTPVGAYRETMRDPGFDLATIPVVG